MTGGFLNGWVNEDVWWRATVGKDGQMDGWICAPNRFDPRPPRMGGAGALRGGCHTLTSLGQCAPGSASLLATHHKQ